MARGVGLTEVPPPNTQGVSEIPYSWFPYTPTCDTVSRLLNGWVSVVSPDTIQNVRETELRPIVGPVS